MIAPRMIIELPSGITITQPSTAQEYRQDLAELTGEDRESYKSRVHALAYGAIFYYGGVHNDHEDD